MTLAELKTRLASTGIAVTYYAWPTGTAPALPWVVYFQTGENTFSADGRVYSKARQISVELYTASKDETREALVETALDGIYYTKEETFLQDERMHETIYTFEV